MDYEPARVTAKPKRPLWALLALPLVANEALHPTLEEIFGMTVDAFVDAASEPGVYRLQAAQDGIALDLTLTDEYERAVDQIGLTIHELWAIDRHALDVAFADSATLDPLRAEFDAWGAARLDAPTP